MTPARIEARDLVFAYDGGFRLTVRRFAADAGEIVALVASNGSGKSTLLKLMAGVLRPAAGAFRLDDRTSIPFDDLAWRRRVAMVFQHPVMFDRSARENVEYGLRLRGLPRADRRRRAAEWIDRFGLAAVAEQNARALSGGQMRRTALARALAVEPDVLLLDEPFNDLDDAAAATLSQCLIDETRRRGMTAVIAAHARPTGLAERVVEMSGGAQADGAG